jgi:hypothetical protein
MTSSYLTKEFARQARRSRLPDEALLDAAGRAEAGKVDADLGGGLIKQRVARPGEGRSGGFRTIIAFRRGDRAIFLHLFPKSRKANLTPVELEALRDIAKPLLKLSDEQLRELATARGWKEIKRNDGKEEDLS